VSEFRQENSAKKIRNGRNEAGASTFSSQVQQPCER
jgi:hypothetical protein